MENGSRMSLEKKAKRGGGEKEKRMNDSMVIEAAVIVLVNK